MRHDILNLHNYAINPYVFGPLIVGILVLFLGIGVLAKERTSHASFAFLFFSLSVFMWLFSYAAMTSTPIEKVALWWANMKHVSVAFIPPMTFIFTLTVIRRFRQFRKYAWASLILSVLFCIGIPANLFTRGVYRYSWGYYPQYTSYNLWFILFFVMMISTSIILFAIEYKRAASDAQRHRLRTFLFAFLIGSLASVDFLAAYGIPVYPFGYLPVLIFLILTARTVLRYRLVDITPSFAAKKIVNTMSDVLVVLDHEGVVRFTNHAATELFQSELVGKPFSIIEGGILTQMQFESVLKGHNLKDIETIYRDQKGYSTTLSIAASLIRDKLRKPVAVVCLARDISEQKRLEREKEEQAKKLEQTNAELMEREKTMNSLLEDLQASQQSLSQLAAIVQFSDDAIFSKTLDGIVTSWNRGAERIYGYSAKEMIGRLISTIIPAEKTTELNDIMESIKQGKLIHQYETVRSTKSGRKINVSITISPIRDVAENIIGASTTTRDITAQISAREQLRISEEHNRLIVETAYDAFIGMDSNGLITDWNEQAKIIFGWTKDEIFGKSLAATIIPERYREAHKKGLARFLITGEGPVLNKRIEVTGIRKNGNEFPCELTIWPIRVGTSFQFNAFVHDITERKKAEEALLQNTAELAKIKAEREQADLFAFAASHDLQEPLAKIIAFGDLLKLQAKDKLDDKLKDYINRIQTSANCMSQLIDSLLRFSRATIKKESLEQVNLEKVVKEVLSDLELKIAESKSVIELGPLPVIKGDWLQMKEVFQNLIANSIKFRKKEMLHRIKIGTKPLQNGYLKIYVADNGIGFEQKYAERLFKPFERLHNRSEYEGSGMGLAICQKIMLRHGGRIEVQSNLGKGAVFMLHLPSHSFQNNGA